MVRNATAADAGHIARIRVASWRVAYDGLLPAQLLDRLDVQTEARRRATQWARRHADPRAAEFIAWQGDEPVGWASVGPCRDDDAAAAVRGELFALYALPAHWSTGVGHALILAAEDALQSAGFRSASLWMLASNARAAAFYERHGWREDGVVKDDDRLTRPLGLAPLREQRRRRDLSASIAP